MNQKLPRTRYTLVFTIFLLVCCLLPAGAIAAVEQSRDGLDAELRVSGNLRIGQTVKIFFDLKGYAIPNGSYPSINVRFMNKPEGAAPTVKAGYPQTLLEFKKAGQYRIMLILNEVSKPSCGGVNAKSLLEETIELQIAE